MIIANYLEDNPDIQFNMENFIDWDKIVPLVEKDFADAARFQENGDSNLEFAPTNVSEAVEGYKIVQQQYGEIMGREVAPAAGDIEREGLVLQDGKVSFPDKLVHLMNLIAQSGILGYSVERKYGGLNLPLAAQAPIIEMIARAYVPLSTTVICFNAAEVIARFAPDEIKDAYIPRMVAGDMAGAMAFTEPNYGSDLRHILTRAEQKEDGEWEISGTKRFITHACGFADKPSAILTLARSGGEGAKGLSFFLVESSDIEVTRLEEKIGQHTSPTCEVVFDKSRAQLIGEEGMGLVKYAMAMMNGARMGVSMQAVGLATAAHAEAARYASERIQFGKPIQEIPAVARLLDECDATIQAMRALSYRAAETVDLAEGLAHKLKAEGLSEREVRKHPGVQQYERLAKLLTPVTKFFTTEQANFIVSDSLQVFGGSGYTEEYDIARIYRDTRITAIYEGTSQLQVVAAIGGIVEGMRAGGFAYEYLNQEIGKIGDQKRQARLVEQLANLVSLVAVYKEKEREIRETVAWDLVYYFAYLLNATLLWQQASLASGEFAVAKKKAAERFFVIMLRECARHDVQVREL